MVYMVPMVREFKTTVVQKLTKVQKNFELRTTVQNFSCLLCSQIICTSAFKFVLPLLFLVWLQAIKNRHWYFTWTS